MVFSLQGPKDVLPVSALVLLAVENTGLHMKNYEKKPCLVC
ncbi:13222_t:CDS:1, partial [Dentiscutata erythropus]